MRPRNIVAALALAVLTSACSSDGTGPGEKGEPIIPVATAIGGPDGNPMSTTIGAGGGTLTSADGRLTITVPAGAVPTPTEFSVLPISNNAPAGVGNAYRLSPAAAFSQPVTLTFAYGPAELEGSIPQTLALAFQNADGYWEMPEVQSVNETARTVSVTTTHFSDWTLLQEVQIQPGRTSVRVGESQSFQLIACLREEVVSTSNGRRYICREGDPRRYNVSRWLVDGISGGNGTIGTVSGAGAGGALFRAPAQAPTPNAVQVAAELRSQSGSVALVFANVDIYDDEFIVRGTWEVQATRTFTANIPGGSQTTEKVTASAHLVSYEDLAIVPQSGTVTIERKTTNSVCTSTITATGPVTPYAPGKLNGAMTFLLSPDPDLVYYTTSLPFGEVLTGVHRIECDGQPDEVYEIEVGATYLLVPSHFSHPPGYTTGRGLNSMAGTVTLVNGIETDKYDWTITRTGGN